MNSLSGNILKMRTQYQVGSVVQYELPIGEEMLAMNALVGTQVRLKFDGRINCIATGELIKKSYNNGFSYQSFMKLAACDICIVKPERCHYHKGTCREPEWGEAHCMQPHIIYLANTSGLKIGITRKSQVPIRWMDQGAIEALPILQVSSRYDAGLIEKDISAHMNDKTNWRKMLQQEIAPIDLEMQKEQVFSLFADLIDDFDAEEIEGESYVFQYPVEQLPSKISSLDLEKTPDFCETLMGIKGQYLIFESKVINIRKYQGYWLDVSWTEK